eukprot:scaffold241222_cov17-Prasinocladus_malaysianus.AAC.1
MQEKDERAELEMSGERGMTRMTLRCDARVVKCGFMCLMKTHALILIMAYEQQRAEMNAKRAKFRSTTNNQDQQSFNSKLKPSVSHVPPLTVKPVGFY